MREQIFKWQNKQKKKRKKKKNKHKENPHSKMQQLKKTTSLYSGFEKLALITKMLGRREILSKKNTFNEIELEWTGSSYKRIDNS